MKILILAAGYAIRLHPLTLDMPKSLLPVGGRTILDRILDKLASLDGVDSIYIITNEKFFQKFKDWVKGSNHAGKISIINDGTTTNDTRHGAIKDMEIAISGRHIEEDLLVVAGDNLFDLDMVSFVNFAKEKRSGISIALYDIKSLEAAKKFGVVKVDDRHRVVDFEEKPEAPKSTLVSTGIYFFPKEKLPSIKGYISKMAEKKDAPGYYISWMSRNDVVYGFKFLEDWCDIGDIESYKKADRKYSLK